MPQSIEPAQLQRIESVDLALAKGGDPRAMQDVAAAAMNHYQRSGNLSDPNLRRANLALVRVGWLIGQEKKLEPLRGDLLTPRNKIPDTPAAQVWRHRQRTIYARLKWDAVVAAVDAALADGRVYWPSGKAPRAAAHDGNDEWVHAAGGHRSGAGLHGRNRPRPSLNRESERDRTGLGYLHRRG